MQKRINVKLNYLYYVSISCNSLTMCRRRNKCRILVLNSHIRNAFNCVWAINNSTWNHWMVGKQMSSGSFQKYHRQATVEMPLNRITYGDYRDIWWPEKVSRLPFLTIRFFLTGSLKRCKFKKYRSLIWRLHEIIMYGVWRNFVTYFNVHFFNVTTLLGFSIYPSSTVRLLTIKIQPPIAPLGLCPSVYPSFLPIPLFLFHILSLVLFCHDTDLVWWSHNLCVKI